jgi:hypothetical protein
MMLRAAHQIEALLILVSWYRFDSSGQVITCNTFWRVALAKFRANSRDGQSD